MTSQRALRVRLLPGVCWLFLLNYKLNGRKLRSISGLNMLFPGNLLCPLNNSSCKINYKDAIAFSVASFFCWFRTLAGRAGPSVFLTLESQPQIILFYYFFGGCGFKIVTGQCGARQGIYSAARLGQFSLNPSATNMKWIYPAFKFNNGLMPQSGSAWHNAPVKRKEAGATRNCHIKPILEKWIRQICLFSELCSVMCP